MSKEYKYSPKTWEADEYGKAGYHTCECCGEDPFKEEPKGNTPIENRKAQGKMTGQWTSYDKVENFDIFS